MSVTAFLGLGSNLGDRQEFLDRALKILGQTPGISLIRVSSFRETDPCGGPPGQGKFLNAALEIRTELGPEQLLQKLLAIENQLGRQRQERWGPRNIDLDLLLYGQERIAIHRPDLDLVVPHPRLHERLFVLEPLAEIAPLTVHPVLQKTVRELLEEWKESRESRVESREQGEVGGKPISPHSQLLTLDSRLSTLDSLKAMVTGSTSGIGRAIVLELARGGADVLIHGRRSEARAKEVAEQVRQEGVRSEILMADLHDEAGYEALVAQAWQAWGGLDIWINNAGADTLTGEAARWPFERKLAELWTVDVRGTMLLSRAVGQRMRNQGSGVIINMGWDQAETGMEGDSGQLFGACKGAIMAFSKSLAISLAPQVRVNCLAPGWIRTAWGEQASAAWQERALRETPLARWGTPEDVAQAARWLVSPAAAFITGQTIRINGGAVR